MRQSVKRACGVGKRPTRPVACSAISELAGAQRYDAATRRDRVSLHDERRTHGRAPRSAESADGDQERFVRYGCGHTHLCRLGWSTSEQVSADSASVCVFCVPPCWRSMIATALASTGSMAGYYSTVLSVPGLDSMPMLGGDRKPRIVLADRRGMNSMRFW